MNLNNSIDFSNVGQSAPALCDLVNGSCKLIDPAVLIKSVSLRNVPLEIILYASAALFFVGAVISSINIINQYRQRR